MYCIEPINMMYNGTVRQARSQDLSRGGAIWRAGGENFFWGVLCLFGFTVVYGCFYYIV